MSAAGSRPLSRRRFGAAALATSALYAATDSPVLAATSPGPFDVVIIGAGAAGIAAARACKAAKVSYVVLEARTRLGGRAVSINSFPTPIDLGAEWFIFATPNLDGTPGTDNPLFDIALKQYADTVKLQPDLADRAFYRGGKPLKPFNPDQLEFLALYLAMLDAIDRAGDAANNGAKDYSARAATAALAGNKWYGLGAKILTATHGGTMATQSTLDLYNISKFGPTIELPGISNWLTPYGMGNFVSKLGEGLAIRMNTPATAVDWTNRSHIAIETPAGTVKAKRLVVTVPLGVLSEDRGGPKPSFNPPLPHRHQAAIAALKVNGVDKVAMQFSREVFHGASTNALSTLLSVSGPVKTVQSLCFGDNVGLCFIPSDTAIELEKGGKKALVDFGLKAVKDIFGGTPENYVGTTSASMWWSDPWSLGCDSYAPPDTVPLRAQLGEPIQDRIFFAGEACSVSQHSSLPGAWTTGEEAALRAMGKG